MKNNEDEKGQNRNPGRNEKGRFVKGFSGGPGKPKQKPVTIQQIEQSLQKDLKSKDARVRHVATRLFLMLKKQQREPDNKQTLDDSVRRALGAHFSEFFEDSGVVGEENF